MNGLTLDPVRRRLRLDPAAALPVPGDAPGWAAELLALIARPSLRAVVDVVSTGVSATQVWATPAGAAVGEPAGPASDGRLDVSFVEPILIPLVMARAIGLRRLPAPPGRVPLQISAAALADPSTGDDGPLRHFRTSWRVSSVWAERSGRRIIGAVQGVDAGRAGHWLVHAERPESGAADATLVFEPVSAGDVWSRLLTLMPRKENAGHA